MPVGKILRMRVIRVLLGIMLGFLTMAVLPWAASGGGAYPPGSTNAVLSFIDDTHVEVVRHWPRRPQDVDVYPFVPYFWDFCLPGMGAIMVLLTAPIDLPPVWALANPDYFEPSVHVQRVLPYVLGQVRDVVGQIDDAKARDALLRSLLPGNPAYEQIKGAIGAEVRSMQVYQKYGYATFLFIKGGWFIFWPICVTTVESVPEGYGIPYVH